MNIVDFIHTYYITIVCTMLVIVHVVIISVLTSIPFPSFEHTALYVLFAKNSTSISISYACTFALSSVLLVDILCELKKVLLGKYGSFDIEDDKENVLSKVAVFVKKLKYPRSMYSSAVSDTDTVTTASATSKYSDIYDGTYYVYYEEKSLLYANLFMVLSFLIPSGMMLFTTSPYLKCIYFCSISQLTFLIFVGWLNIAMNKIHNIKPYTLFLFVQIFFFSIERMRDIMLSFYGGDAQSHFIVALVLRAPLYIQFMLSLSYIGLYVYGRGIKMNADKHHLMFSFVKFVNRTSDCLLSHNLIYIYISLGALTSQVIFPYDNNENRNHRNESINHIVSLNWVFVVYLVLVVTKRSRSKTEELEKAYSELNKLNNKLSQEKHQYERTLCNMVPPSIAYELNAGRMVEPRFHKNCCIFVSKMVGFDKFSSTSTPIQVFRAVDKVYHVMDNCLEQFPTLNKIESKSDSYLVVAGLQLEIQPDPKDDTDRCNMLLDFVLFSFLVQDIVRYIFCVCFFQHIKVISLSNYL